jgi:hypothetical protein
MHKLIDLIYLAKKKIVKESEGEGMCIDSQRQKGKKYCQSISKVMEYIQICNRKKKSKNLPNVLVKKKSFVRSSNIYDFSIGNKFQSCCKAT